MNLLQQCKEMKSVFVIGLLLIIGNYIHAQIPQDTLSYYRMNQVINANPDTIYALDLSTGFFGKRRTKLSENLKKFKHLKGLRLTHNKIVELPSYFSAFKELQFLYINKNKLEHFPPELYELSNLIYLDISRNKIDSIPSGIKHLKKLKYLDIWNNHLAYISPDFALLQQLEYIDFRGTSFSPTFVKSWVNRFPNATVKFDQPCNCLE